MFNNFSKTASAYERFEAKRQLRSTQNLEKVVETQMEIVDREMILRRERTDVRASQPWLMDKKKTDPNLSSRHRGVLGGLALCQQSQAAVLL